jgi:hypothetical protein
MSYDDAHVAQVREILCSIRRLIMWEIAEECNISIGSCHDISEFVPRLLTQDERDSRVPICQELLGLASEDEIFLKRIITGNETWVYGDRT